MNQQTAEYTVKKLDPNFKITISGVVGIFTGTSWGVFDKAENLAQVKIESTEGIQITREIYHVYDLKYIAQGVADHLNNKL